MIDLEKMSVQTIAEIQSNKRIATEHHKMSLLCPEIATNAKPGQFVHIKCSEGYDPFLRRPFSVHRTSGKQIEILYKVIGKGTALLSKMKPGETVDILGPLGNDFSVDEKIKLAIIIAGGYGVAPLLSLCEAITNKNPRDVKNIYVLLGARNKECLLSEDSFKELGVEVRIASEDGSCGTHGLVTDLLTNLLEDAKIRPILKETCAYSCGPTPMLKAVAGIAHKYGISSQASLESHMGCGIGACLCCVIKVKTKDGCTYKRVCKDGPIFDTEKIIWE